MADGGSCESPSRAERGFATGRTTLSKATPSRPCPLAIPGVECSTATDVNRDGSAEHRRLSPVDRSIGEHQVRHFPCHRADDDLGFHTGERSADTEVDAPTERNWAVVETVDEEAIGVGKAFRVTVGREEDGHNVLASSDVPASDRRTGYGAATQHRDRRIEPEALLDGRRRQCQVG